MKKAFIAMVLVLALLTACGETSINPTGEKEWKKTVKLSNGEVILGMTGEWDNDVKTYGELWGVPVGDEFVKITQEGATFMGVIQNPNHQWLPKGTERIKGELDENGFKAVSSYIGRVSGGAGGGGRVWEPCKWEIGKNGNKIMLDCGERIKMKLNRK